MANKVPNKATDKATEAAERFAKITQNSYRMVVGHAVGLQERNTRFAQDLIEGSIREMRQQAESNLAITQELAERAEEQSDAFRALIEESRDAYRNILYAPFSSLSNRASLYNHKRERQ